MKKDARIFVAGHKGLVGSAILKQLQMQGYTNILTRSHAELDLVDAAATEKFFAHERPEYVFLAAAKVGGIHANNTYPAEFIHQNLAIGINVIHACWKHKVTRLLYLGSSCVYPKLAPQPLKEEYLLTGELEPTNRAYALAKISGIEMCWSYNRQYGTKFLVAMPTNLFGEGDNYHPENSHVIPALMRKFHEAKISNAAEVVVWGTGTPKREFLYNADLAEGCVFLMNLPEHTYISLLSITQPPMINIGTGQDMTIRELAELMKSIVGYKGTLRFDSTMPDGTPRKLLDVSRIHSLGWKAQTSLADALARTYRHYQVHV